MPRDATQFALKMARFPVCCCVGKKILRIMHKHAYQPFSYSVVYHTLTFEIKYPIGNIHYILRMNSKGRVQKKKLEKVWSFAKPPSDPPPGLVIFPTKKIDPQFFFFRNKTLIGWNKFYTWSHLKIYSFFAFIMASIIAFFPPGFGAFGLLSKLS